VVVTGAPVTRYLPLEPTAPVMVVEAIAFLAQAAKSPNPKTRSPSKALKRCARPAVRGLKTCVEDIRDPPAAAATFAESRDATAPFDGASATIPSR
jgi:hypothetical protein